MKKLALLLACCLPLLAACDATITQRGATTTTAATAMEEKPPASQTTAQKSLGEEELRSLLTEATQWPVLSFEYGDFGGDGISVAFAFVEIEDREDYCEGELWFVGPEGAKKLEGGNYCLPVKMEAFGGRQFAVAEVYYSTSSMVNLWGVKDGRAYKEEISGHGGGLQRIGEKDFTLVCSAYDANLTDGDWTGHTWKNYWFYWNGETFREYGGVKITEGQLRRCDGAAVLDGLKAEGKTIGDIFYRGNGIINVNCVSEYGQGASYSQVALQLSGTKVTAVEGEYVETGGSYAAALVPGIAVYPELPEILKR